MKKISKIKLTSLSERELNKRQMKVLKGGYDCYDINCNCGTISPAHSGSSSNWKAV